MSFARKPIPASRLLASLMAMTVVAAVTGCSSVTDILEPEKIDYKSAAKTTKSTRLDVPPDLTVPKGDSRYSVTNNPSGTATASDYSAQKSTTAPAGAPTKAAEGAVAPVAVADAGLRIERAGKQRWLVASQAPDVLWPKLKAFWEEQGFKLAIEKPEAGVMETDWAENRAKIPQDFIRSALGKIFDSLYSTGERDKFRTRLERNANGGTEIFVTHRGMVEVYSTTEKDQTVWQPRPADPELEAEFLRRLMVKLGVAENEAKALSASAPVAASAKVATVNNVPVVQFNDNFDRAWRRVGLSLDRTGFTVEDRNRTEGTYFVRYVEPMKQTEKPGFFSRILGASTPESKPERYRVVVRSNDNSTTVSVLNAQGQPDASPSAQRIIKVLADDLR